MFNGVAQITVQQRYSTMEIALNATGRPILYQMCEWGVSQPWLYGSKARYKSLLGEQNIVWPVMLLGLLSHTHRSCQGLAH